MSSCAHGESTPHRHVDVATSVATSARRSSAFASATLVLAAILVAAAVAAAGTAGWWAGAAGAAGWATATLAGSAALVLASGSAGRALVAGAVVSALVSVAAASWVASSGGPALWAAAGWALAGALSQFGQSVLWRRTLHESGQAGEFARDQAVRASDRPWLARLAWWAVPTAAFGLWVWVLGVLPLGALVLAPAAVVLQLLLTRRNLAGAR
ncbi:MAG: hypothetical protein ACQERF_05985 [Actinomycetota bacterium]